MEIPRDDIRNAVNGFNDLLVELADGVLVVRTLVSPDVEFLRSLRIKSHE